MTSAATLIPIRTEQAVQTVGDLIELHKGDRWIAGAPTAVSRILVNRHHVLYAEAVDDGAQTVLYIGSTSIRVIEPYDVVAAALQRAGA